MRRTWTFLGFLAVLTLWGATATANFLAGLTLTPDDNLKWIFGAVSAAADVLKVAALFAMVASALAHRWGVMVLSCIIFLLCTIHSVRSTFSFTMGEVEAASLTRTVEGVLATSQVDQLRAESRRHSWLANQSVEAASRNMREAASSDYDKSTKRIEQFRSRVAGLKHRAHDDPIAKALAVDEQTAVLATGIFLTLLLELGSSCGFYILTRAALPKAPRVKAPRRVANDDAPEQPDLAPIPTSRQVHKKVTCIPPLPAMVRPAPGAEISARELREAMASRGLAISDAALGAVMRQAGVRKRKVNGRVVYLDLAVAA